MKIAEYKQMMAYLTRPGFSGGGNVLPKKKPKEEAEKVNKARKEKNFEKVKGALENPDEVKQMFNNGGSVNPRPQNQIRPMSKALAEWYEENKSKVLKNIDGTPKPPRKWEDLEVNERASVKSQFEKRNNPFYKSRKKLEENSEKLKNFLQKQKSSGRTVFNKQLNEIAKEAKVKLTAPQVSNVIDKFFPNTFNYKGLEFEKVPGLVDRVKELTKTNTIKDIEKILYEEGITVSRSNTGLDRIIKKLNIPVKKFTEDFDTLVKNFLNNNPKIKDVNAIAKNLTSQTGKKVFPTSVLKAAERIGIEDLNNLQADILKDVKVLDRIIKTNTKLINNPNIKATEKNRILESEYLKKTGKKIKDLSTEEFGSRLSRLAKLYAGKSKQIKGFDIIKSPSSYLETSNPLQKNILEMTSKAKQLDNYAVGQILGLPKKELNLISDTRDMMQAFDFKVAGDHTDIKSMMKDFPNYKKNFSRIEYIKNNLNLFKRRYDLKINALRKNAERAVNIVDKQKFLNEAKQLKNEFEKTTGYRIGTFDIKNNRVMINPQTARLSDLKNPLNTALQTAMTNFQETTSPAKGEIKAASLEKFKGLDKRLMNASASERAKIFKDVQGTKAAKESLYLKALQKVPKIGKIATAVIGGTAGAAGMSTLAQAADGTEATSVLPTAVGAGTGAAAVGTKTGRNILGKVFRTLGTPLAGAGFAATNVASKMGEGQSLADAVVDPITGLELSFPGLFKENLKKIIPERFQGRAARFGRGLLGLRGIPVGPIGLTLAGLGQAQEFYNQYQDLQRMKEQNPRAYSEFMESRQTPALSAAEQTAIEDMGRSGAAGGGIMKMAGKSSGRPPESGPTPQGLDFLLKRGR